MASNAEDGPGPTTEKARKIAEAKAKLASLQQRKGKALAIADSESDAEAEAERQAILKRESKNAYVLP